MDREQILRVLQAELEAAQQCRDAASKHFGEMISPAPSGVPYPDSVERIREASREYSRTQQEVLAALRRLNEFLIHGTVTVDLKRKPAGKETANSPDKKVGGGC